MREPILELQDVRAAYGRIEVLRGVTLSVPRGSVVALLGPNGAGKSTTLKVASGLLPATSGHIHLAGAHVNGSAPDALARAGVCTIPEGRAIFPNLTVDENLQMTTWGNPRMPDPRERAFQQFPRLKERHRQLAGTMSGGEQQMLAVARAIVTDPALLLLDELSMGLAPRIVEELYEVVGGLAETGMSVLVTEQFARTVLQVAEYAALMANGRVVAFGQPADLEDEILHAYLGGNAA